MVLPAGGMRAGMGNHYPGVWPVLKGGERRVKVKKITLDEALHLLEEGTTVYMLKDIYDGTTVSELMCASFVAEETESDNPPPERKNSKPAASGSKKKLDHGKIQALHNAGWSHAKIADEMGCTTGTVATVLSKLKKGEHNGKEQSSKADAGTEEADQRRRS